MRRVASTSPNNCAFEISVVLTPVDVATSDIAITTQKFTTDYASMLLEDVAG
jgi:hypothetical protein